MALTLLASCTRRSTTPTDSSPPLDPQDSADSAEPQPCASGEPGPDWLAVPLLEHPQLEELYGSALLTVNGEPVVVALVDVDCYVALHQRCTHEGCAIEYRDNNRFVCPCHGALFDFDGTVLGGPAPSPLAAYAAIRQDDILWINPTPGL